MVLGVKSGDVIGGRYQLRAELGRGGMSVVWRADDDVLGRSVAVKVLSPALAGDPESRQRIRAEARVAAGLRHDGIVAVFDYGEFTEAGQLLSYVVMELVEGRSLNDMLAGDPLPWRLAVLVGAQVAAALAAAHRDGIVHRDVKPANVMVTRHGVKLVDFGISAAVGELDGHHGLVLGTPGYLAPERIEGGPVRPATDVYALGLLLYRMLAGRMPWPASTVTQMLKAHVYLSPAPLPEIGGLPVPVTKLVSRCLAKKPGDRPSSAEVADFLGELAGLAPANLLHTASQPTVAIRRFRIRRVRPRLMAGVAAAALLTLGGSWWIAGGTATTTPAAAAAVPAPVTPSSRTTTSRPAPQTRPAPPTSKITAKPVVVARTTQARRTGATRTAAAAAAKPKAKAKGKGKGKGKGKAKAKPGPGGPKAKAKPPKRSHPQ